MPTIIQRRVAGFISRLAANGRGSGMHQTDSIQISNAEYIEQMANGDFKGHPFRGNQWADGSKQSYSSKEKDWLKEAESKQREAEKDLPIGVRYDCDSDMEKISEESAKRMLLMVQKAQQANAKNGSGKIHYGGVEDFVMSEGEEFFSPKEPIAMPLMKMKECYKNSAQTVLEDFDGKYGYVEGFVITPKLPYPINHAWVIDKKTKHVIDRTLGWNPSSRYYGVEFGKEFLIKKLVANGYYGLFLNKNVGVNEIVLGIDKDYEGYKHGK